MQVEVTQADREAAASVYASEGNDYDAALVPGGGCDHWPIVEAFARHRLAERERSAHRIAELEAENEQLRSVFAQALEQLEGFRREIERLRDKP